MQNICIFLCYSVYYAFLRREKGMYKIWIILSFSVFLCNLSNTKKPRKTKILCWFFRAFFVLVFLILLLILSNITLLQKVIFRLTAWNPQKWLFSSIFSLWKLTGVYLHFSEACRWNPSPSRLFSLSYTHTNLEQHLDKLRAFAVYNNSVSWIITILLYLKILQIS